LNGVTAGEVTFDQSNTDLFTINVLPLDFVGMRAMFHQNPRMNRAAACSAVTYALNQHLNPLRFEDEHTLYSHGRFSCTLDTQHVLPTNVKLVIHSAGNPAEFINPECNYTMQLNITGISCFRTDTDATVRQSMFNFSNDRVIDIINLLMNLDQDPRVQGLDLSTLISDVMRCLDRPDPVAYVLRVRAQISFQNALGAAGM